MATKKKKTRNKKPTKCRCFYGWVCEVHLNLGNIVAATLQQTFVKILSAIKIPILFLYWDSPEEENRQSEKLHSTLEISLKKRRAEALTRQHGSSKSRGRFFMEEQYKGCTIQVTTEYHNANFPWKPICRIMSEGSRELIKQLDWDIGYDTPDQAEKAGMLISKKWIDAGKPNL